MAHLMSKRSMLVRIKPARILLIVGLVWLVGPGAPRGWTQTYLDNVGVPTFATNIPVENGFVNAANGNLHLEIPLGTFPQRGGSVSRVVLMYDSAIWLNAGGGYPSWGPNNISSMFFGNGNSGWRLVTSQDRGYATATQTETGYCRPADDYEYLHYSPWIWAAPDGTTHSFQANTRNQTSMY
jgi:hypothetical protein